MLRREFPEELESWEHLSRYDGDGSSHFQHTSYNGDSAAHLSYGRENFSLRPAQDDDDDRLASSRELRKKSKEIHKLLSERNKNQRREDRERRHKNSNNNNHRLDRSASSDALSSKDSPRNHPPQDLERSYSVDSGNTSKIGSTNASGSRHQRPERERQFKQITFKPNYRLLTGNETCGVDICKKLFGITIFEYSNGKSRLNNMTKDRKLVVQGVMDGTESQVSGKIHRGEDVAFLCS